MNKNYIKDFVVLTKELALEAAKIYKEHPDQDELIHFRNLIENTLAYIDVFESDKSPLNCD